MMINGLLAAFKTDTASVIALWSAKLTGGDGQQDTTLHDKHTSVIREVILCRKTIVNNQQQK